MGEKGHTGESPFWLARDRFASRKEDTFEGRKFYEIRGPFSGRCPGLAYSPFKVGIAFSAKRKSAGADTIANIIFTGQNVA